MPYLHISDFKNGMDRRRDRVSGQPGSLWLLKNAHITRGGDIERAKKFVPTYTLPGNTFGLAQTRGQIFVFGSADLAGQMPTGIQYQRLINGSASMTRILDVKVRDNKFYVIAEYDNGTVPHFYNGIRITDWDTISDANASLTTLADYLADKIANESEVDAVAFGTTITFTAREPSVPFTISATTVNGPGGVSDQTIVLAEIQPNAPGQTQTWTARLSGTLGAPDTRDIYTIEINDTSYSGTPRGAASGVSAYVTKTRVWSVAASLLRYCKLNDPTNWTDATETTGAGFINISTDTEGADLLVGAANYNTQTAIFSRSLVVIYTLDTDPKNNQIEQPIENSGTFSARSVVGYGNQDLFYLDSSGIRSLRSKTGTSLAFVSDVGSAIDPFIADHMDAIPRDKTARAVSTIEPRDGRFMMALAERVYVLSYFPAAKISAWSYYEPGFEISDFVRARNRLYALSDNIIYCYGGLSGNVYPEDDEQVVSVQLPFMSANTVATDKGFEGFDAALSNEWEVSVLPDPNDDGRAIPVGRLTKITYSMDDAQVSLDGNAAVFAVNATCSKAGRATISSLVLHYKPGVAA